jgi:hypothetical protein
MPPLVFTDAARDELADPFRVDAPTLGETNLRWLTAHARE